MKSITLDRAKIKSKNKYLLKKKSKFNEQYNRSGGLIGEYYSSKDDNKVPFNLFIATSYIKDTLTIEFSSKILKERYPLLISKDTIGDCLENLNRMDICEVDIDSVLDTGCFTSMDITEDKTFYLSDEVLQGLNDNVGGYRRYKWQHYEKEGIEFQRDVKSKDCKECIKLYRKGKEIQAAKNQDFLKQLSWEDRFAIIDYFADKTRFEMTLNTQRKIKEYLNIKETYIWEVLNAISNPLLRQFDKVFDTSRPLLIPPVNDWEDFAIRAVINQYGGDMKRIEQEVKRMYDSRSGSKKRMDKIETVKKQMEVKVIGRDIIGEVRSLLV